MRAQATLTAHRLNQPLTAILCDIELTMGQLRDNGATEAASETMRRICSSSRHVAEILKQLQRAFPDEPLEREPCDLTQLIHEVCEIMDSRAGGVGARLERSLDADLTPQSLDKARIAYVISSLVESVVESARETAAGSRSVTIGATPDAGFVSVTVRDMGGEPSRVSEPQPFQPHDATGCDPQGIVLLACHTIVESHGGVLRASAPEGRGAAYQLSLPTL